MNQKSSRVVLPLVLLAGYWMLVTYAAPNSVPDVKTLAPAAKAVVFGAAD